MLPEIPENILDKWDILVIDDDEDGLAVATIIMTHYGAIVHTAHNGKQGFDMMKTLKPNIVLCDISMPIMNGWQFIDAVQKTPELAQIPTFALTAHAMVGDREKAVAAGFYNYLTKPLTVGNFMQNLLVILESVPILSTKLNLPPD